MNKDQKHVWLATIGLAALVAITAIICACVADVARSKSSAASGMFSALREKQNTP